MEQDNQIEITDPRISPQTHNVEVYQTLIKLGIDKEKAEFQTRLIEVCTVVD